MTYGRQKVMWAMSIVQKLSELAIPNTLPANTNMSISEIPVIISGFVIGMSVTVLKVALIALFLSL